MSELAWNHSVQDIPDTGLSAEQRATLDELSRIAAALDLIACRELKAKYSIVPTQKAHYKLKGFLQAQVEQACVVTLEPVVSLIEETFEVDLWPGNDIPAPESGLVDLREDLGPEPIEDGQVDVGRIVFEHLAGAIDPYPRKPGAIFVPPSDDSEVKPDTPFAVLAGLKAKD